MRKFWIGFVVVLAGLAGGIGAGFGISRLAQNDVKAWNNIAKIERGDDEIPGWGKRGYQLPPGQQKKYQRYGCPQLGNQGRRGNRFNQGFQPSQRGVWRMPGMQRRSLTPQNQPGFQPGLSERSTAEQALAAFENIIANDSNLSIGRIMEFENAFYAQILEKDTGRGAYEISLNPYNLRVRMGMGPWTMWNSKFGHMRRNLNAENALSLAEAQTAAQEYLDGSVSGAVIEGEGTVFDGYYTFVYSQNSEVAGLVGTDGQNGDGWLYNQFGKFINTVEVTK